MTHSFKPGDRVVIVRSPRPERIGEVTTVVSELAPVLCERPFAYGGWGGILPPGTLMHALSSEPVVTGIRVTYPPEFLEPYRPDHNERAEWTDELRKLCGVREDA